MLVKNIQDVVTEYAETRPKFGVQSKNIGSMMHISLAHD